jgi:hypothetical protein
MKSTSRISQNWYIHLLYTRKDFNECLKVIEEQLKACNGQSDYALYIKGELLSFVSMLSVMRCVLLINVPFVLGFFQLSSSASKDASKSRSQLSKQLFV